MLKKVRIIFTVFFIFFAIPTSLNAQWVMARQENFDQAQTLTDQVPFGDRNWLTTRIRNGGSIVVSGGFALVSTPDFQDSAMIRIEPSLSSDYRIKVRLQNVNYGVGNYEAADYDHPDFKYSLSWVENGFYWLTLTDRAIEPTSGEDWWHRYRKIVMDSDDHTGVSFPLYMVYMNPDLDRSSGNWLNGYPNLLRCWSSDQWFTDGSWRVAFTYAEDAAYEVELEKYQGQLTMRAYNSSQVLIEETDSVDLDLVYEMGEGSTSPEYAYVGEPHIDSYEGNAQIDSIELWVYNTAPSLQDIDDETLAIDEEFSLTLVASDDTFLDTISLSSSTLPDGATFSSETGVFTWTPTQNQKGTHTITFTVEDEYGLTDSKSIDLKVDSTVSVRGGCGVIVGDYSNFFFFLFMILMAFLFAAKRRDLYHLC